MQTETPLWPWPHEDIIKEHMCNIDDLNEVHRWNSSDPLFVGRPGWCESDKSLTEYIWEANGATCPEDICTTQSATAKTLASFDFAGNNVNNGFPGWNYSPYGDTSCNIYNAAAQSKMCSEPDSDGSIRSLYYYYNGYNSDHMGWMRWGYIDAEETLAVKNSSLKIVFTGGAYDNNGEVAYSGAEIRSKEQFDTIVTQGSSPYGDRILPGDLTFYFKSGSRFHPFEELVGKDRLSVWILPPENSPYTPDYQYSGSYAERPENLFGWYPFVNDSNGDHYYHNLANINMGGWIHLLFDAHPVHNNGGDHNPYSFYRAGGSDYPGDAVQYFNNVHGFAIRAMIAGGLPSPSYMYIDEIESYKESQPENDETIANIGVGYSPLTKQFDISFNDKYRCAECNASYEVRYSFSPLTNANFTSASLCNVTNFDRETTASPGVIKKPANGYLQIWAALDISEPDKSLLTDTTTIYFAVKDISDRSHLTERDAYDLETVNVNNLGPVRRVDLVKTIDYTLYPVNRPLAVLTTELADAHTGETYSATLLAKGGHAPYFWGNTQPLPQGMTISADGNLHGMPLATGNYTITLSLHDSAASPDTLEIQLDFHVYNKEICTDNVDNDNDTYTDCQDADCENHSDCFTTLVDFGSDATDNIFGTSLTDVFMDIYTGYSALGTEGTTTLIGSNGAYNHQGVQGGSVMVRPGDKIKVFWYNSSTKTVAFTPKISFNDANRPSSPPEGDWYAMSYIEIEAESEGTTEFVFTDANSGLHQLINISSNSSKTNTLICSKILLINSGDTNTDILFPWEIFIPAISGMKTDQGQRLKAD